MVSTDGAPLIDCVLQVVKSGGEHETIMFTCSENEFRLLAWLAEHMRDSLKLTRISDGPAS